MEQRERIKLVFFIALFLFILYQVGLVLWSFLTPLFWAAVIAFGLYPLYEHERRARPGRDNLSALLVTLLVLLVIAPVVALLIIRLSSECVKLYYWVTESVNEGGLASSIRYLRSLGPVQRLEGFLADHSIVVNYKGWLLNTAGDFGRWAAGFTGALTKGLVLLVIDFTLTILFSFFFLRDGDKIYRFIYELTPLDDTNKADVFFQVRETFAAVLRGQIVTAAVQAIVAGVVYWLLGIPLPVLFAALTFLAALIPLFGPPAVWLPIVIYLALARDWGRAAVLLCVGAFVIGLIDNFMKPILIGNRTKLPYLLLFIGILGGLRLYGLIGIFLAPVVLSLFFVLIRIYRQKFA